ncbi:ABC transporter substrate-binding protein [Shinella sp. S4-D37]|uniref:ABC transporter substrate-binding protein n=1 Tax=Shinella sp. S4-D37 TaxID=3161999 RepID=UPI0034678FA0
MNDASDMLGRAKNRVAKNQMSRRDFMQLAIATGLSVTAAQALLTTQAQAQPQPKKGGLLRLGISNGSTSDSLDPATYNNAMTSTTLWGSGANSLTEVDAAGNITPDLAESFDSSDGAKTWMFKLRRGVTFHDGRSLTAKDVVASIRHHMGPNTKSGAKGVLAAVSDVKADGDETVVFTLSGGNADFPFYVSDYHLPIMQANDDGSANWQSMVRTGPFIIESFEPGIRASLKRNPNYHRDVWFDELTLTVITDVAARTNALVTGAVDYIDRCELKTVGLLERNPDIEIDKVSGYEHFIMVMNTTVAPFDNPKVRNALKYAIDREDIAKKVFAGINTAANDNPIAPSIQFSIDPQPVHRYDPDKARALLKEAGLDRLSIDLSTSDAAFAGAVDAAVLFKEHARAAGIDINVIREPADSYWDKVWMKVPMCVTFWNGRPTADWMFANTYAAGSQWNETAWQNARFNELLLAARVETDNDKRAGMYAEMQQLVHDDGGLINIAWSTNVSAHNKSLSHGAIATNWDIDGRKLASRWWRR